MKQKKENFEPLSENEKIAIKNLVENALNTQEEFSVSLDNFWELLGYDRKDVASKNLKAMFNAKEDFVSYDRADAHQILQTTREITKKTIILTMDCAIKFAKTTNIPKSKLVGDFMIICKENFEKINKGQIKETPKEEIKEVLTPKEGKTEKQVENISQKNQMQTEQTLAEQNETTTNEKVKKHLQNSNEVLPELERNLDDLLNAMQKGFDEKLNTISNTIVKNFERNILSLFDRINKMQNIILDKILFLEKDIKLLKKYHNIPETKDVFVLIVTLDKSGEKERHKMFIQQNPVFVEENEKKYLEQSEVLFSLEFNHEAECKSMKKHVSELFKFQNAHLGENYFDLKPNHFKLLQVLQIN